MDAAEAGKVPGWEELDLEETGSSSGLVKALMGVVQKG